MKTLALFFALVVVFGCSAFSQTVTTPELVLKGETYHGVTLKKEDEMTAKMTHDAGIKRVKIAELSGELQTALGYNPAKAEELRKLTLEWEEKTQQARWIQQVIDSAPIVRLTVDSVTDTGLYGSFTISMHKIKYYDSGYAFVEIDTYNRGFVDGATYHISAIETGTTQFKTVLGATRTVQKFTSAKLYARALLTR